MKFNYFMKCMKQGMNFARSSDSDQQQVDYSKYLEWYDNSDEPDKMYSKKLTEKEFQACLEFNSNRRKLLKYTASNQIQWEYDNFFQYFKRDKNGSICVKSRKSTIALSILGGALVGIIGTKLVSKSSDEPKKSIILEDEKISDKNY